MSTDARHIYLKQKDFAIEIPLDEYALSQKLQDITECLRLEFAPIEIWHRVSIELYRHGLDAECNQLLATALEDDLKHSEDWNQTVSTYNGSAEKRINILAAASMQAINALQRAPQQPPHGDQEEQETSEADKRNVRNAVMYYKLVRGIAAKFDNTERYNMVFHFLGCAISIGKAMHQHKQHAEIASILVKTKHDLCKAISVREMGDENSGDDDDVRARDNDDDDGDLHALQRQPHFLAILCTATLSYSIGHFEDALTNFHKLLRMCLRRNRRRRHARGGGRQYYLGFVHLGIGISALKLKEFDIARHAFERAKKIDKLRNHGDLGYIAIKSSVGLALVYLNQVSFADHDHKIDDDATSRSRDADRKLKSVRKALREITDTVRHAPNNPQLLVLMANFIGFSFATSEWVAKWAGTAYDLCQASTRLIAREPTEQDILNGLDQKFLLRNRVHSHHAPPASSSSGKEESKAHDTLSTCSHPLAQCQAEACYVLAKMYHCQRDYDAAIRWYYKSVVLAPYFVLALFGLAQMYIHRKAMHHSKSCLERILELDTEQHAEHDCRVLVHYAFVCRQLGDTDKAQEHLEKACKRNAHMVSVCIDLAEISESTDASYAIQKYLQAKSLLEGSGNTVPFELFNNMIVLLYRLKDYAKAKQLCEELIAIMNSQQQQQQKQPDDVVSEHSQNEHAIPARQIVVQYNYARVLDELCEYKKARRIYKQIVVASPAFIEAHLCSALFLWRTGKFKECVPKLEEAIRKADDAQLVDVQLSAMLYLHRLYVQIGDREQAYKTLKRIDEFRKQTHLPLDIQNDEYSELAGANYIVSMSNARSSRSQHPQKNYYERLHQALRRFQQVLVTNPNNVFAVHGLGVIAAEAAELSVAKSILSKLRDCFSASNDATCTADMVVNLGHVFCAYQQWDAALKCYERAKRKLAPHQQGDIPLYIVRALFAKKDFATAKLRLQQLLRFHPTQELYLFNLALIEEEHACDILRKDARRRTLWEVENVMQMLDNAKKLYKRLDANNKRFAGVSLSRVGGIPQDKLSQHLNHIRSELMENATKHLEFQRAEQVKKEKKRQQEQKKLEKTLERERRDRQQQEMERLRTQQQLKQKALDAKVKGSQITIEFPDQNGSRANAQRKRKRKNGANGDTPDVQETTAPPPNKRAKLDEDAFDEDDPMQQFMGNNENGEFEVDAQRNRFHVDDDEDGGGDFGMLDGESSEKKRLKKKDKKKKKKKKENKDKTAEMDPQVLAQIEAQVTEIVANSNLDTLTPRQVRDQIAVVLPDLNMKLYKKIIAEYIQEAAKKKQAEAAS